MRIIYCADTIIDANLVKGVLESEGIRSFIGGEALAGAIGELPRWNLVNVMVADEDVERALPIARAIDAALSEPREAELDESIGDGIAGPAPGIA